MGAASSRDAKAAEKAAAEKAANVANILASFSEGFPLIHKILRFLEDSQNIGTNEYHLVLKAFAHEVKVHPTLYDDWPHLKNRLYALGLQADFPTLFNSKI